jgi:hypothetical protein
MVRAHRFPSCLVFTLLAIFIFEVFSFARRNRTWWNDSRIPKSSALVRYYG